MLQCTIAGGRTKGANSKSKNITSRFGKNFLFIPRLNACKTYSKYPGIKLESASWG